jgi:hypothetical protein
MTISVRYAMLGKFAMLSDGCMPKREQAGERGYNGIGRHEQRV